MVMVVPKLRPAAAPRNPLHLRPHRRTAACWTAWPATPAAMAMVVPKLRPAPTAATADNSSAAPHKVRAAPPLRYAKAARPRPTIAAAMSVRA